MISRRFYLPILGCIVYHNLKGQMFQFGGIQQHSIMLQIILFLYFIQSWSIVQILVKLLTYMHIILYNTGLFVSLSLYSNGPITGVILYQSMHVCWSILI